MEMLRWNLEYRCRTGLVVNNRNGILNPNNKTNLKLESKLSTKLETFYSNALVHVIFKPFRTIKRLTHVNE